MKITIFTGNQSRHLNLIRLLSKIADQIFCVFEVNTVFPGTIEDFFKNSKLMKIYFEKVINAEKNIFGNVGFLNHKVKTLTIKRGDLNLLPFKIIKDALKSDVYIIFGASYIKGWLADFLINKNTYNIHMGMAPYYRGAACNFWALFDNNPSYVGATIIKLSEGLDKGDILFHATPELKDGDDTFLFSMRAVEKAHLVLFKNLNNNKLFDFKPLPQNKKMEIRYTQNKDFNDEIIKKFFKKQIDLTNINYKNLNLIRHNV